MDFSMIETKIELRKLIADEGMTLTDGEIFGKEVYLGKTDSPERWQEIPDAEAERLQKELEDTAEAENA